MMRGNKFWWFVSISIAIIVGILITLGFFFWQDLDPAEASLLLRVIRTQFGFVFAAAFLALAGVGFLLDGIFHIYILPLARMKEETLLINSANPAHRIRTEGSVDILALADGINELADRCQAIHRDVDEKIQQAKAEAEEEKNILAAFMAELPEGVIICNSEGQILLYNLQAKAVWAVKTDSAKSEEDRSPGESELFIGLGRSIFSLIDKNLIVHALDEIAEKLQRSESNPVSSFVFIGRDDRMHRVEAVPVLNPSRKLTGFILILFDITRELENETRMGVMIDSLIRRTRASAASIRSVIEAILDFPQMDREHLDRFNGIIHREALTLGELLDETSEAIASGLTTRWPLVRTRAEDFLETVRKKAEEQLKLQVEVLMPGAEIAIKIDTYSLATAFLFLMHRISGVFGCSSFSFEAGQSGRLVNLDLRWDGQPIRGETLRRWEKETLSVADVQFPLTLEAVLRHHDAEVWSQAGVKRPGRARLRILVPLLESSEPDKIRSITILPASRPEFYDFDLFSQPGQNPELDQCLMRELAYTVFDTETTGLDPSGGDEIISIGAVRIVNGRLLREESFDQLVQPRRSLTADSIKIHGILPDMLVNQPPIEQVLPRFQRFAEGTILVAHNAAFDMKMLQLKEASTGIRFINPVLDTLLLSAAIHPSQVSHNLEEIAQRLGISIVGRHTALGDAIATAEIFLKLLSLMAKAGIHTLQQARIASQKTFYARKKY